MLTPPPEFLSWIEDDLDFVRTALKATQAVIRIHITGAESKLRSPVSEKQDIEDQGTYYGRPDFPSIIHQACRINTGRIAFVGTLESLCPRLLTTLPDSLWARLAPL